MTADVVHQNIGNSGITDALVRISVGIENIEDIKDDIFALCRLTPFKNFLSQRCFLVRF